MATLRELAAQKKTPPPTVPAPRPLRAGGGGLILKATADSPVGVQKSRVAKPHLPRVPGVGERLLGTENQSDVIPMFPPRGPGVAKEWEAATLLPASSLGIIMDHSNQTGWLACSRPGMPPLLLYPLPILGRLSGADLPEVSRSPCENSHGSVDSNDTGETYPPPTAPPAG